MGKKKSYNPFKMWGSYVGFSIGVFISTIIGILQEIIYCTKENITCYDYNLYNIFLSTYMFLAVLGFLIGWGIHSLFRAMRK